MDKIQEIREAHAKEENFLLKYPTSSTRKAHEYIGYLLQQIEIKDKALEFYADRENWRSTRPFRDNMSLGSISEVAFDNGNRARAALKGEDTP